LTERSPAIGEPLGAPACTLVGLRRSLYDELALPGWERAREPIADYLGSLSGYRKNVHRIDPETIDVVDREWGFAVEAWGYRPP